MRKTSQDAGDTTSITSGLDGESKKPGVGILKTKRSSIKRKVQSFSLDSDDAVAEPLLQRDKEKTEIANQSAKFLLLKTKTDSISEKENDTDKLLADNRIEKPSTSSIPGITDKPPLINGINDNIIAKSYVSTVAPIHNHMNTNVFGSHDGIKGNIPPKTQILVELDGNKSTGYNPSPLIFTTAKIHTDGKIKQMEPVQMTPMPILSTIESSILKAASATEYDKNISASSKTERNTSNISVKTVASNMKTMSKDEIEQQKVTSHSSLIPNKDIKQISKSGEAKLQNAVNKITTTCNTMGGYTPQPLDVDSKSKTPIAISSRDSTKINVISPTLNATENKTLNDDKTKITPLTDSTKVSMSEIVKTSSSDKDLKPILSNSGKMPIVNTSKEEDTVTKLIKTVPSTSITTTGKLISSVNEENKMDINKNFETVCSTASQKPGTSNDIKSPVDTKSDSSRIVSNKLQRQKSSQIENKKDIVPKAISRVDQLETKQYPDLSKDNTQNKPIDITDKNLGGTNALKISSANNVIVSNASKLTPKITATSTTVQSKTSKPSVVSSTFINTPVTSTGTSKSSNPVVTSTVNKAHPTTVLTTKPLANETNAACYSKPTSTPKSMTTDKTTNVTNTAKFQTTNVKPAINVSSSTVANTSTVSSKQSNTASTISQSGIPIKPVVVSTIKTSPITTKVSLAKTTTNTTMAVQSISKGTAKPSTTKVMNTQISAAKPTSSIKAVTTSSIPSTSTAKVSVKNKQGDSKTSERNKDTKGFK